MVLFLSVEVVLEVQIDVAHPKKLGQKSVVVIICENRKQCSAVAVAFAVSMALIC